MQVSEINIILNTHNYWTDLVIIAALIFYDQSHSLDISSMPRTTHWARVCMWGRYCQWMHPEHISLQRTSGGRGGPFVCSLSGKLAEWLRGRSAEELWNQIRVRKKTVTAFTVWRMLPWNYEDSADWSESIIRRKNKEQKEPESPDE